MNSMDSFGSNCCDILEVYRRFCDIGSGNLYVQGEEGYRKNEESQMAQCSREALAQLSKLVETRLQSRISVFDEILKLMSQLDFMVDFSEFSHFYDFVFFICRENGQKNITVKKAVTAWRLVLDGRFRLLNHWCDFVEKNQRHNISEDTWRQVLAFSRCVHENLEGYDPEGAWPVLIDEFVEHMYRVSGSNENCNFNCNCGDSESESSICDDSLPGLKSFPGLKRKSLEDLQKDDLGSLITIFPDSTNLNTAMSLKRNRLMSYKPANWEDNLMGNGANDLMEITRCNSTPPLNASKYPCAIEGCLSKGLAGLFPTRSCLHLNRDRRVSFAQNYKSSNAEKILHRVI
ncbi:Defective-in-cullin neddylation protein [Trema orientale]|uniref:Defective in cullin neddylation protein n=1 Tax=Trema orientale TaxID=63057 RepID=A0A2P5AQ75_TREOI|nr:Defective-in-cullin neddylation protein [Trema orientale]